MKMFASDNNSGVHPKILEAICDCNKEHVLSYGDDLYTKKAIEKFKEVFGEEIEVYFVANGTGANVIGLSSLLRPFEGVICADTAHINVDECGAIERFSGSKLLQIPHHKGKITIDNIKKVLHGLGDEHHTQPKVISISQVTEFGTVYSIKELKELADFAHENKLLLHVDGSRISNAAAALGCSFKEMLKDTGVDLVSFGGTKNGMMYGEAIISFNPELSKNLKYARKQGMQLLSKMRFIATQFIAFLEKDLWRQNAAQANSMAKLLEEELKSVTEVKFLSEIQSNMIFAEIPREWIEKLQERYYFYVVDEETSLVRWVTSYDTTKEEVMDFVGYIKGIK